MPKKPQTQSTPRTNFKTALIILLVLFLAANFFAFMISGFGSDSLIGGNVALIPIKGEIFGDKSSGLFSTDGVSSTDVIKNLQDAKDDPAIKAVILEINSPGGSAVASSEIGNAVKELRADNKTVVAWIREEGASGAYWIASDSDYIVAHPLSITGSIGVTSAYLEFSGLMKDYNVTYERMVAGNYKDIGSPYRQLTPQEELLFQNKLKIVQDAFINEVAANRKLTDKQIEEVRSGIFYLGTEAKALNLVDELGGKKEATDYLQKKLNETITIKEYKTQKGFWAALNQMMNEKAFYAGQGVSSMFVKTQDFAIKAQ